MIIRLLCTILLAFGLVLIGGAYKNMEDNTQLHIYVANNEAGLLAGKMAGGYFKDGGVQYDSKMQELEQKINSTNERFWLFLIPGSLLTSLGLAGVTSQRNHSRTQTS